MAVKSIQRVTIVRLTHVGENPPRRCAVEAD